MLSKMFKGPNRILKMVSVVLVVIAVIGCLIWIFTETANIESMATEFEKHDVKYSDTFYSAMVKNGLLMAISSMLGVLIIALAITWLKTMVNKASTALKMIIIVQAFILLGVTLIWCITDTIEIIENHSELMSRAMAELPDLWVTEQFDTIPNISNAATEAIITHALSTVICAIGVVVGTLVLYSIVDGAERIVISLEKIAENTKPNKDSEHNQCMCDMENADCHTSEHTDSQ